MFQQGAFAVSISGKVWHSVGIDESHEKLVNKSCKTAIVRLSKDYINRVMHYLPKRTTMLENLSKQLFPEEKMNIKNISLITENITEYKRELDMKAQITAIEKNKTSSY